MDRLAGGDAGKYSGGACADDPAWRVDIDLGPSRRVQAWITGIGAAGVVSTLAAGLPWLAKVALVSLLACAMVRAARRDGCREGRGAVVRFRADLAGRVRARFHDGREAGGRLAAGSFVAPWLTIVRWIPDGARLARSVLVVPDAVDESAFRRLRILLRWRG